MRLPTGDMPRLPPPPPDLLDGAALFLDFDGTLVELADTPDGISVPTALGPMLERLKRKLDGRLAIVSGRSLADLEAPPAAARHRLFRLAWARASAGRRDAPASQHSARARRRVRGRRSVSPWRRGDGFLVERKPAGIALHYRRAPGRSRTRRGIHGASSPERPDSRCSAAPWWPSFAPMARPRATR